MAETLEVEHKMHPHHASRNRFLYPMKRFNDALLIPHFFKFTSLILLLIFVLSFNYADTHDEEHDEHEHHDELEQLGGDMDQIFEGFNKLLEDDIVRAAVIGSYEYEGDVNNQFLGSISDINKDAPDIDTVFEIGSITKVFTALLIQTLVDEELLSWDDTIGSILKDIEFSSDLVKAITLRELATHRSGLPRLPDNIFSESMDQLNPYKHYGEKHLSAFLQSYTPETLTKTVAYSNLGFGLLGYIGAMVLETDYPTALKTRIFDPLDMTQSSATGKVAEGLAMAKGYSFTANMPNWDFNVHAGAGAILSTATDLIKFIEAHFVTISKPIHESLSRIRELQYDDEQGLGWFVQMSRDEHQIFLHSGQTGGYSSLLAINPTTQQGWFVLATSTDSMGVTVLGISFFRDPEEEHDHDIDFAPYVGVYELDTNQGIYLTISERDGKLFGQATGQSAFPLTHFSEHIFTFDAAQIQIRFKVDEINEQAPVISWTQANNTLEVPRVDDSLGIVEKIEIELDADVLKPYAGKYQFLNDQFITIINRDKELYFQLTGQAELRIYPMSETEFYFKAVDAEVEFELDEDGNVTGLILNQAGEYPAPRID